MGASKKHRERGGAEAAEEASGAAGTGGGSGAGRPREHRKHRHRGGERRGKRSRSRGERGGSGEAPVPLPPRRRRGARQERPWPGRLRERAESQEGEEGGEGGARKLRAKLGLKPLETSTAKKEAGTKEDPVAAEVINPLALRQREEIREKLAAAKEKRLLNQKLGKVKTLGEEEPWLDDAAAWIERSRALQREKELAEKRAKLLEEMDQEFGVSPLVEEEFQRRRRERYSARDLQGLTVEHDPASIPEGQTLVLTLKDRGVLEAGDDVLEQVALAAAARAREEQELRRRRPPYDPYGQEEPGPGPQRARRYRDGSVDNATRSSVSRYPGRCRDTAVNAAKRQLIAYGSISRYTEEAAPPGSPPALEEDEAEQELQQQLERGRRLRQLRELREGAGERFSASSTTILDEEPIVNRGLAAALLLCQNKGLLETTVQKVARVSESPEQIAALGRFVLHRGQDCPHCPRVPRAIDDKYSRREEYRGFTQDFKEKEGYRRTSRSSVPAALPPFHGKGSGKMKTERRMKKLDEEGRLLKKMSSSDTPLGTVALLQEKQRAQKTPYIVLSGSGKSMNA
ncbi:hypothetical protein DUI87_00252 [Hirundo rustica rustica]|uniref:Uncharacterized protein n=1 Tax=Hirundo rustica rustica TaxID=333673 RepID=A0A3M0LB63_HIRRU|nr:hypothetical protein DUI87_00252 [Hirundo rustica rustica]